MGFEPAAGGELGRDAGGEKDEADGEGADDPADLHAALEHEPVEQGQHEDEHGRFGKEGRAAMRGDGDEVDERGGGLLRASVSACGEQDKTWTGGCYELRRRLWTNRCSCGDTP